MESVAIMITSCDAYKECWRPMVYSLDKYWPDCEYPRYIVSNFIEEDIPNTTFIKVGRDNKSWCNLARMGMEAIGADYVIFFQEDYWLGEKVNNSAIKAHIQYVIEKDLDYLKIQDDIPRDKERIGNTDYCLNIPNTRYSINTAIAIWKVSTMSKLMIKDWSGWEFERKLIPYIINNKIELKSQILHSSVFKTKGITPIYGDAIVRGVWTRAAVDFLKENSMDDIICTRRIIGPLTSWLYKMSDSKNEIVRILSWGSLRFCKSLNVNW